MKLTTSSMNPLLTSKKYKEMLEHNYRLVGDSVYKLYYKIDNLKTRLRSIEAELGLLDGQGFNAPEMVHHFMMLISLYKSEIAKLEAVKESDVQIMKTLTDGLDAIKLAEKHKRLERKTK